MTTDTMTDMTVETTSEPTVMVTKKRICYREWQFFFSAFACLVTFCSSESFAATFFCWIATSNLFDQIIFRFMKCTPSNRIKALKPGVTLEDFNKYTHCVVKTKSIIFCIYCLFFGFFVVKDSCIDIHEFMIVVSFFYIPSFYMSIWTIRALKKIKYPYEKAGTYVQPDYIKHETIYDRNEFRCIATREFLYGY